MCPAWLNLYCLHLKPVFYVSIDCQQWTCKKSNNVISRGVYEYSYLWKWEKQFEISHPKQKTDDNIIPINIIIFVQWNEQGT